METAVEEAFDEGVVVVEALVTDLGGEAAVSVGREGEGEVVLGGDSSEVEGVGEEEALEHGDSVLGEGGVPGRRGCL